MMRHMRIRVGLSMRYEANNAIDVEREVKCEVDLLMGRCFICYKTACFHHASLSS